jgi:hypothetical protein
LSYTPPLPSANAQDDGDLIRVGLYIASHADPKHWVGSLTSRSSFTASIPTLTLFLGPHNEVHHVSLSFASLPTSPPGAGKLSRRSKAGSASQLDVKFVVPSPGPNPSLNSPIVLSADGTGPEEVVEKTLFQKYTSISLFP